jgi:hypothetical protein
MEHVLSDPVELTEFELDAVAGGFDIDIRDVDVRISQSFNRVSFSSSPDTDITNLVDNSVHVSF